MICILYNRSSFSQFVFGSFFTVRVHGFFWFRFLFRVFLFFKTNLSRSCTEGYF